MFKFERKTKGIFLWFYAWISAGATTLVIGLFSGELFELLGIHINITLAIFSYIALIYIGYHLAYLNLALIFNNIDGPEHKQSKTQSNETISSNNE
jgi:hypothetical protein